MTTGTPIVDALILLEKYPGKGGWTYAALPGVAPDPNTHFGWVRVYGSIDSYSLDRYQLMPMGKGKLFLPVKAAIRKIIRKEAGDSVYIILYEDKRPVDIPLNWAECLRDEPDAHKTSYNLAEQEQCAITDHIYKISSLNGRIKQMTKEIAQLLSAGNKTR